MPANLLQANRSTANNETNLLLPGNHFKTNDDTDEVPSYTNRFVVALLVLYVCVCFCVCFFLCFCFFFLIFIWHCVCVFAYVKIASMREVRASYATNFTAIVSFFLVCITFICTAYVLIYVGIYPLIYNVIFVRCLHKTEYKQFQWYHTFVSVIIFFFMSFFFGVVLL